LIVCVRDSSVALSWCFEDEATNAGEALLDRLVDEQAAVPALWHLEIANVLALAERKKRISAADSSAFAGLIGATLLAVDAETPTRALGDVLNLARAHDLTAYDAAYLELAMRLGVPLATRDEHLRKAAKKSGVPLLSM
jgi:predicted nucleic acid-binding protein